MEKELVTYEEPQVAGMPPVGVAARGEPDVRKQQRDRKPALGKGAIALLQAVVAKGPGRIAGGKVERLVYRDRFPAQAVERQEEHARQEQANRSVPERAKVNQRSEA